MKLPDIVYAPVGVSTDSYEEKRDVLAGSNPHYHTDVLRKTILPEEDVIAVLMVIGESNKLFN